mgnify:FL=1
MYYVNREQIERRLALVPTIAEACRLLVSRSDASESDLLLLLAQERALHLAIELVTDVGSLMIDGFLMRDASSYEDIVDILKDEGVFPAPLAGLLTELVRLRKPLVHHYTEWDRSALHPIVGRLPEALAQFTDCVRQYLRAELGDK